MVWKEDFYQSNRNFKLTKFLYTHALIKLHIAATVYYINTLDIQSSGRGRGGPNFLKVGDLL